MSGIDRRGRWRRIHWPDDSWFDAHYHDGHHWRGVDESGNAFSFNGTHDEWAYLGPLQSKTIILRGPAAAIETAKQTPGVEVVSE